MRFSTWKVGYLYSAGVFTATARELARNKLDIVCVQVRWGRGNTVRAEDYNFFYGKGNENQHW